MPAEEEKEKKFKAVTEEVTVPDAPKPEDSTLAVSETNNIVSEPSTGKHDAGVFFKFFLLTFFATLLALALAGGIYVYFTGTNKSLGTRPIVTSQTPTPVAIETPVPTASPSANVDLTAYKVSVLNGNGGIGTATAAKVIIEKAGFKVGYLGNADNFNFANTLIQVKTSVPASVVAILKNSLSSKYTVSIGDPLDPQSPYDIVVTVGGK